MALSEKLKGFFNQKLFKKNKTARCFLEEYKNGKFYFRYLGTGRSVFTVLRDELWKSSELVLCLASEDAIVIGAIIGEHYRRCILMKISFNAPVLEKAQDNNSDYSLISYNLGSHQITCQGPNGREKMHVIELAQSQEMRKHFSVADAYQIGFYAGERLFHLKNRMRLKIDSNSTSKIITFPG
jgi:hypothetical protein